jgi:hypothetical protein
MLRCITDNDVNRIRMYTTYIYTGFSIYNYLVVSSHRLTAYDITRILLRDFMYLNITFPKKKHRVKCIKHFKN